MGGAAGGKFVEAQNLVDGDIVADADDDALFRVLHHEIDVGDATAQRFGMDRAAPERQAVKFFERRHVVPLPRAG